MKSLIADILGSSGFIPIRLEVGGNIAKINTKIMSDTKRFGNLLSLVDDEIQENLAGGPSSATSALLWLIKYLMFIHGFLTTFMEQLRSEDANEETFIRDCLLTAYENVLRDYHNSVIHNVFSVRIL